MRANRTKVVATLGPSSRDPEMVAKLVRAGVDVFRLNATHLDHRGLVRDMRTVRRVARQLGAQIGILVDLQGPKIRVGPFENAEPIWLQAGQELILSTASGVVGRAAPPGEPTRIGCSYPGLAEDVQGGQRILLDDGYIELRVLGVEGTEIRTRVVHGGLLKQFKGINVPGSAVRLRSLSEKDLADLECALEHGTDYVAQSFVRSADDVAALRERVAAAGSDARLIAKIERPEAIKNLASILEVADGLMVARGDMGVELGPEAVPVHQKRIIRKAIEARKPVITATQMLESMVTNPRPTRAEASDVANAIYDGTSAVMLSAETATGKYPLRVVRTMESIVRRTERDMFAQWEYFRMRRRSEGISSVAMATVRAAVYAALEAGARLIAVFTESGQTAQLMAAERTPTDLVAFTPHARTVQRLALTWGVRAMRVSRARTSHEMTLEGQRILLEEGLLKPGDRFVVVFGTSRMQGLTNIMNIRTA